MTDGASDGGAFDSGTSPLYTPDQMRRLRLQLSRSPFYCDQDFVLRLVGSSAVSGSGLSFFMRFEGLDGTRKNLTQQLTLLNNRTVQFVDVNLGEGLLFGVNCNVTGPGVDVGAVWAEATLVVGKGGGGVPLITLFAGFPTTNQVLGWPYAVSPPPSRIGLFRVITGTTPAAGTEFLETCPSGALWDLVTVFAQLTPFGAGQTRAPQLRVINSGVSPLQAGPVVAGSDANTFQCIWAQSPNLGVLSSLVATNFTYVPLPTPCTLLGGDTFASKTANFNPGGLDQWTAPIYLVRESLRLQ